MRFRSKPVIWLLALLLAAGMVGGGWTYYTWQKRLLRVGDVAIDPLREVDPTKVYDVLVWEHDPYIPGIDRSLRRAALEAAAAELNELYPNIRVRFEWPEGGQAVERLREALEAGVGPDIAALAGVGALVDPAYQVPVTPYMSAATQEDLLPSVRDAIHFGDHLWVWPRWIDTVVWVGRTGELGDLAADHALFADDLLRVGKSWQPQRGSSAPIAYNAYDPVLFYGIAVATIGRTLLTSSGEIAWSQAEIENAAQVLRALIDAGLVSRDIETVSRSRLGRFYTGEAVLIGPVNRTLLHHVLSRLGELTHDSERLEAPVGESDLTLLSAPIAGEALAGQYGAVPSYAVFRRAAHAGDDHTQAVMQVAQHLSRRMGYWEAANILAVPPYASATTSWPRDAGLMQEHADTLIRLAERLVSPPTDAFWARAEQEAVSQVILPLLPLLMQGGMTPEQFAEDVWKGVQSFLAARSAPTSTL